jgi:ABC-type lipoprotein export system ATPase subunit
MIRCQQLSKTYRTTNGTLSALSDVNLEIREHEFVVLRGPSGCGKTTLLLVLGGMLRPTSGLVRFQDRDLYSLSVAERARLRAREIGFVFQMFHLVPYLTVEENARLAGGAPGPDAPQRVRQMLEQVGLGPRRTHRPSELSAGERQRAALARALTHRPHLVLADEPTGNLDPDNAAAVFDQLARYHREGGTVFVVTHGPIADSLATRCLELRAGRLVT